MWPSTTRSHFCSLAADVFLLYWTFLFRRPQDAAAMSVVEKRLWNHLFANHNSHLRPVTINNNTVQISIQYWLLSIQELNERQQQLSTFGFLEMSWKDEALRWNESEYNGQIELVVPTQKIWIPDIVVRNSDKLYGDFLDPSQYRATVMSDGTITYWLGGRTLTVCILDLTYLPFDVQACNIEFNCFSYLPRQVEVVNKSSKPETSMFRPNGLWTLEQSKATMVERWFYGEQYVQVRFIFHLKRKPLQFVTILIIPSLVLSLLSTLVFLLPAEGGEKISLGITVLLSYTVFLLIIQDTMPESSDYIPIITIYLMCAMILSALSLFATVLVLREFHRLPIKRPPAWLRYVALQFLARWLCMSYVAILDSDGPETDDIALDEIRAEYEEERPTAANDNSDAVPADDGPQLDNGDADRGSNSRQVQSESATGATVPSSAGPESSSSSNNNNFQTEEVTENEAGEAGGERNWTPSGRSLRDDELTKTVPGGVDVVEEWQAISRVLDRLLFFVFLLATIVIAVVLLGLYPLSVQNFVEPVIVN